MQNPIITGIGLLGGILISIAYVFQTLKSYKTRKTQDVSLWMYVTTSTGSIMWLIYGIMLSDTPIILANIVALTLSISMIIMKLRWG